jgi:protease-4
MRRLALFLVLFTLLGAVLAGAAYLWLGRSAGPVGGKKLLTLRLDSPLVEYVLEPALPFPGVEPLLTLSSAYRGLAAARKDPNVVGLAIYLEDASFGLAKAQELRRQLLELGKAGKPVTCYLETAGEGGNGTLEYFVASACGSISLAPAGEINLLGMNADSPFLRGSLDKLKIEPSFLTAGTFKSAAEIFTEERHSPPARAALEALLDGFFSTVVRDIAASRKLEPEAIRAAIDRAPLLPAEALEAGLVDLVEYPDEFRERMEKARGSGKSVALADYARAVEARSPSGRRIAVVFAVGAIVRGAGGTEPFSGEVMLGSRSLARTLDDLADDDSVVAVVLRVDSPGGSALASDLILREVERLKKKKPVIVSMSDVAASGGYYIAAKATKIVAEEATITGSIGVVSGKLATGRFQEELLGITHDPLRRGGNAGLYSTLAPFDERELALMRRRIDDIYVRFLDHVAAGRGLDRAAVDAVAQGRVWTGTDAREHRLVDELGGFDRAIELARDAAGVAPEATLGLAYFPRPDSLWDWLQSRRAARLDAAALSGEFLRTVAGLPAAPLPRRPAAELVLDPAYAALSRLE